MGVYQELQKKRPNCNLTSHGVCSFESWVGQESKLLAAGYISTKAGGPKKAYFDSEAQDKITKVQEVIGYCLPPLFAP